eukprot:TRINITY_DN12014_c0_g1_i2.p1 TRINITY_DN12014_c0_g1~~TRINITY_DN12014_c0_g1_i2.p1  ORF type:complete len:255 (+),score=79.55 TRINITY_DN12014_c0_g1_i2:87-851(+)
MIRRPPRSTLSSSSAASDVYKRQLLFGVVGIAFCKELTDKIWLPCFENANFSNEKTESLLEPERNTSNTEASDDEYIQMDDANDTVDEATKPTRQKKKPKSLGIIFALMVGLAGGTVLVPAHYVPDKYAGLAFVPSQGIGAGIFAIIVPVIYFASTGELTKMGVADLKLGSCFLPGLLSGLVWNIGNIASIWAIPRLGYSVAYPILQCALLFSALWGVFVFKEITRAKTYTILFVSGVILLGGAAVLSISVKNN